MSEEKAMNLKGNEWRQGDVGGDGGKNKNAKTVLMYTILKKLN